MQWDWSQNDITFDQNCWTFDGSNNCEVEAPATGGTSKKINRPYLWYKDKFRKENQAELDRMAIIKEEDDLIIEFIKVILTKGLI